MVKNNEGHVVSVSPVYVFGGYGVKCNKCGKIGRGMDENKRKAKAKANTIASNHRASGGGAGSWLGF